MRGDAEFEQPQRPQVKQEQLKRSLHEEEVANESVV